MKSKKKKDPIAQAMVAKRNKKLSPARRSEIARDAAQARWAKKGTSTSVEPTTTTK